MIIDANHGSRLLDKGFFSDESLDFATRGVLGRAVHGASELGEVLATIGRIRHNSDWAPQWALTAQTVQREADADRSGGHLVSAASGYLRAATYWACVVDGVSTSTDAESELLATFRSHRQAWDAFVDCSQGAHLQVEVSYEDGSLPGYLLRPDASGTARSTVIITNGSDGAVSDLWTPAAGALSRGWNAFVYDGPGQQSMLFEQHTHFRPDWEAVLTPVVDTLSGRDDVDPERLTGWGVSQAGYWLTRALAFEHRLVAAVVDPGVVDVSASWTRHLSAAMVRMLHDGSRDRFDRDMRLATKIPSLGRTLAWRSRPYEHTDWYDLYRTVMDYRVDAELAARIRTPMLITDPDHEQFWPGQSQQLAQLVPHAETVSFSASEGADHHCQPLGRQLTENRAFNWLEERLDAPAHTR